jgi:hypothetical protein
MFKRFWESLNYWAEVLDDPHGEYMLRLEERVEKREREVGGLRIQPRTTLAGWPDHDIHQLQSRLQQ